MTGPNGRVPVEHPPYRNGPLYDVALSYDDIETITKALWDLAALHSSYPKQHREALHGVRRYLVSVQVALDGGTSWAWTHPALPPEST